MAVSSYSWGAIADLRRPEVVAKLRWPKNSPRIYLRLEQCEPFSKLPELENASASKSRLSGRFVQQGRRTLRRGGERRGRAQVQGVLDAGEIDTEEIGVAPRPAAALEHLACASGTGADLQERPSGARGAPVATAKRS